MQWELGFYLDITKKKKIWATSEPLFKYYGLVIKHNKFESSTTFRGNKH